MLLTTGSVMPGNSFSSATFVSHWMCNFSGKEGSL